MKENIKRDIKNCAWDLYHGTLGGVAIIAAWVLTKYITKYDTAGLFYECLGSASIVTIGGLTVISHSAYNFKKHYNEYKQHKKE